MTLKKTLKNGNDSVLLYYFVQCTLKGKKKNSISAENPGKRAPAIDDRFIWESLPLPPLALWALGTRMLRTLLSLLLKLNYVCTGILNFLKMVMSPILSQFQLLPKWWRGTWLVSRVYLNNWP